MICFIIKLQLHQHRQKLNNITSFSSISRVVLKQAFLGADIPDDNAPERQISSYVLSRYLGIRGFFSFS